MLRAQKNERGTRSLHIFKFKCDFDEYKVNNGYEIKN